MTDQASNSPLRLYTSASADWRQAVRLGHWATIGGFGMFILWASVTKLDSAAIAPGVISSESNKKTVQHLEGGIIQELLVRDGMQVAKDQLLVKLDPTRLDTQGDLYRNQLAILLAQEARLLAEFEVREKLEFPQEVLLRENDAAVRPVVADQRRLFASRRAAVMRNTGIADSQIEQARKDIELTRGDIDTAEKTLEQVQSELNSLLPLFKRQLVPMTRIAPLERERLRLQGVISNGAIQVKRLDERVQEAELKRQQVLQDYKQEASTVLVDVRKQLNDARQQLLLTSDLQKRAEIRAPIGGVIQQLRIFTVGGVIKPGDPILDIAPLDDELVIRSRIAPHDADRVQNGMVAEVRFPSFNYWGSKVIRGTLRSISRDRIVEPNSANKDAYFAAEVVVDKATLPEDIRKNITAGIEAQVVIVTGERTVASYIIKPFADRVFYSLRER